MKAVKLIVLISLMLSIAACGSTAKPALDQAAVNVAVQGTLQAQQNAAATIDAAVKATSAAQPKPTAVPQATAIPQPTSVPPTPVSTEQYVTMTEEELTALIDQAVAEAVAASTTASTSTTTATADDALTQAEVDALIAAVNDAYTYLDAANAAIAAYYDLYGELATETVAALQAIEQELATVNGNLAALTESLNAINATLQQGLTLAEDTINQLEATAQEVKTNVDKVQTQAQTWLQNAQMQLDQRVQAALNIQPDDVKTDRQGALQNTAKYVDSVRSALTDNKLSPDELTAIARDGANASASLKAAGGPELQGVADSITSLTTQLARGQMPQAKASFSGLQASLPTLPSLPQLPKPSR